MSTPNLSIPIAIIIAGMIIAGAIVFVGKGFIFGGTSNTAATAEADSGQPINVKPVTKEDHILGNPNAPVILIEFSDLECPFCKRFHETMKRIMEVYGEDGKVAWVFRQFPLASLHSKAHKEAEATECARELGGQLKFWEYTNKIFEITPSNNGLDLALLPQIAEDVGLDRDAFEDCLQSGRQTSAVEEDLQDGLNAGARGTPFSVILTKDGKTRPISGALNFDTMKAIIEEALASQ